MKTKSIYKKKRFIRDIYRAVSVWYSRTYGCLNKMLVSCKPAIRPQVAVEQSIKSLPLSKRRGGAENFRFYRAMGSYLCLFLIAVFTLNSRNLFSQYYNQLEKTVASDRAVNYMLSPDDLFGSNVCIGGDYAIVGAYQEDHNEAGNNYASDAGAAYVYKRSGYSWVQVKKLVAPDRALNDFFGYAVSINGNYAVVGAYQEDEDENGSNTLAYAGSVYIFEKDKGGVDNWGFVKKIVASDRNTNDLFGMRVSVSGKNIVVSAAYEDEDASGMNTLSNSGSVYVFNKDKGGADNWGEVKKIVASDRAMDDVFGISVSIDDNYIVVGASFEDEDAGGGNTKIGAGSAYIYEKDNGGVDNWGELKKIVSSDRASSDYFGNAVSISDDYIVVGASSEDQDAGGGNTMSAAGSAYIFKKNQGGTNNWGQIKKIVASDRATNDGFGSSVFIDGNWAIIGAPYEDEDANGTNTLSTSGSAYIFHMNKGGNDSWGQTDKIIASDRSADDQFGFSVSVSGNYAIAGAPREDEDVSGLNTIADAGSVYFFRYCVPTSSIIYPQACASYVSPSGLYTWTVNGNYLDTITNAAGCDSVITINLTINNNTSFTINPVACNNYASPSGLYTWTTTGSYSDTIASATGCDSILTINLTINNNTSSTANLVACNSYISPSGLYTWTTSGTYTDTISSALGCDSILSINLIVHYNSVSTISVSACDNYLSPSGFYNWTVTGTYTDTIPSATGCDSILTINLTIDTVDVGLVNIAGMLQSNQANATYQWLDCNNNYAAISGETFRTYLPPNSPGSYAVQVSVNGCVDTSSCETIVPTGFKDALANGKISIYPNPGSGVINIQTENSQTIDMIRIIDVSGRVILEKNVLGNSLSKIDISSEAPGIYLVEIFQSSNVSRKLYIKD